MLAVLGYLILLLIAVSLAWSASAGQGWMYLIIPVAALVVSGLISGVAYLASRSRWRAVLAGTLALVACDLAAALVVLQQPFLF
jgi:hypothetical protein